MTDDIVTRLREAHKNTDEVASVFLTNEAADEIERLRFACHFLAGWLSYHDQEIDPKKAVKIAYKKAVKHERHSATSS